MLHWNVFGEKAQDAAFWRGWDAPLGYDDLGEPSGAMVEHDDESPTRSTMRPPRCGAFQQALESEWAYLRNDPYPERRVLHESEYIDPDVVRNYPHIDERGMRFRLQYHRDYADIRF